MKRGSVGRLPQRVNARLKSNASAPAGSPVPASGPEPPPEAFSPPEDAPSPAGAPDGFSPPAGSPPAFGTVAPVSVLSAPWGTFASVSVGGFGSTLASAGAGAGGGCGAFDVALDVAADAELPPPPPLDPGAAWSRMAETISPLRMAVVTRTPMALAISSRSAFDLVSSVARSVVVSIVGLPVSCLTACCGRRVGVEGLTPVR